MKAGCTEGSQACPSDRTRGKGSKYCQGRFTVDIRENFFVERVVSIGTNLPEQWWGHCPWSVQKA